VSFGRNMTTDDSSDNGSMQGKLDTAIGRFHARKFGSGTGSGLDKKHALKVQSPANTKKKQKTPVKSSIKGAFKAMIQDEQIVNLLAAKDEQADAMEVGMAREASSPQRPVRRNKSYKLELSGEMSLIS
jgi:hypothetical protein